MANGHDNSGNSRLHTQKTLLGIAGVFIAVLFSVLGWFATTFFYKSDGALEKATTKIEKVEQDIGAAKLSHIALQGKVDTLSAQMTQQIDMASRLDTLTRAYEGRLLKLELERERPKR